MGLTACFFTLMVFEYQYDYGAFKALLFGWWAIVLTIAVGLREVWQVGFDGRSGSKLTPWALTLAMAGPSAYVWAENSNNWYAQLSMKSVQPFRELYNIAVMTKGAPVRININDELKNAWAVYFLRNAPADFMSFRGYMAQTHVLSYMQRASRAPGDEFLLAERGQSVLGDSVWSNSQFELWRASGGALSLIEEVQPPNGLEQVDGKSFLDWFTACHGEYLLKRTTDCHSRV